MSGAEASSSSRSGLVSLSDDCLILIAQYLKWNFEDLTPLFMSGSRDLQAKFERGIQEVSSELRSLSTWPRFVFRCRNLHSLSLKATAYTHAANLLAPFYVKDDLLIPDEGHQKLSLLEIQSTLAFTVLHSHPTRPSLGELLPSLTKLILSGDGSFTLQVFENLPPNLTELSLGPIFPTSEKNYVTDKSKLQDNGSIATYPLEAISKLPRSLTSLIIKNAALDMSNTPQDASRGIGATQPSDDNTSSGSEATGADSTPKTEETSLDPKSSFPPSLTLLHISCQSPNPVFPLIPTSVTDLTVDVDLLGTGGWDRHPSHQRSPNKLQATFCVSDLENLVNLASFNFTTVQYQSCRVRADRPFPSTLTRLKFPYEVDSLIGEGPFANSTPSEVLNDILPRALIEFSGFDPLHGGIDWYITLPVVQDVSFGDMAFRGGRGDGIFITPMKLPPLTSLYLSDVSLPDEMIEILPETLETLTADIRDTPVWMEKIVQLKKLKSLYLAPMSGPLPSQGFWDVVHERIESISMRLEHLESLDDMVSGWKRLTSLTLDTCSGGIIGPRLALDIAKYSLAYESSLSNPSEDLEMFNWPRIQDHLTLEINKKEHLFFFDAVTRIKDHINSVCFTYKLSQADVDATAGRAYDALKGIPDSVSYMYLNTNTRLPPSSLWSLPKGLATFIFYYSDKAEITKEHLYHLPPKLGYCKVGSDSLLYEYEKLPPALTHVPGGEEGTTRAMIEYRRQRLVNFSEPMPEQLRLKTLSVSI